MPARLRSDLNGLRVQLPGAPPIYLVDLGKKRHIPNPQVYNELFSTWERVTQDINIDDITTGDPIPETAILFKYLNSPKVYLLDGEAPNQVKRHIVARNVMDRYRFHWGKIHVLDPRISFNDGTPIRNP